MRWIILFALFGLFILSGCQSEAKKVEIQQDKFSGSIFCISKCNDWRAHDLPPEVNIAYCDMLEYQLTKAQADKEKISDFVDECKKRANQTFDYDKCIKGCVE